MQQKAADEGSWISEWNETRLPQMMISQLSGDARRRAISSIDDFMAYS